MATRDDLIAAIQAAADATGVNTIRLGLGAPGDHVKDPTGETRPTGGAWEPEPKTWPVVVDGFVAWYEGPTGLKAKLNELIGAYMQLKADYDSGTVPTAAPDVLPLP